MEASTKKIETAAVFPGRKGWRTAGWQGMTLQTPPEWNLVAYGGDFRTGNMRLDNAAINAVGALGIEVRWSQIKGTIRDADLEKRVDQYLGKIAKSARGQKIVSETKNKALSDPAHADRPASRSFSWRADRRGYGRIWHCSECGRLVIAQVTGEMRGDFSSSAADILNSMACHSAEIGWRVWSLYDLNTQIPSDYTLQKQPQLMNIYVQLGFVLGQSLDTISVEQWSVANVQRKGATLEEWLRQKNRDLFATVRPTVETREAHGHEALFLTGRRSGLAYWLGTGIAQLVRFQRPAIYYSACVWECPESNKIHLVQCNSRRKQLDRISEIVGRTPCHF